MYNTKQNKGKKRTDTETPFGLCEFLYKTISEHYDPQCILDPCCGDKRLTRLFNTDTINYEIIFGHKFRLIRNQFLIISYILQRLIPPIELFSLMNLSSPIVDHIEIIVIEVAGLLIRPHYKMILPFLEKPFGLLIVKQYPTLFDFIQLDNITG